MGLKELREEINEIDDKLLQILLQRMDVSRRVADEKRKSGIPVLNAQREQEILAHIGEQAGVYADAMQVIYATIMDVSRASQHQLLGGGDALRRKIRDAISDAAAQPVKKIACQGVRGAYSHEAAARLFPMASMCFYPEFEDVFVAVRDGEVDYGVLPVENSTAGSVHDVYDLILKYKFYVAGAVDLPIHHCLLAVPGAKRSGIQCVYTHPKAIPQCKEYIKAHKLTAVTYPNTAGAAEMVSKSGDPSKAAIASRHTAELYGLQVLDEEIQDTSDNTTRFIVISRSLHIPPEADKISLSFSLPHTTGSLYRILGRFSMCGLNLTKIESRPIAGKSFEYYFYLDFSGHVNDPRIINLMCALSDELPEFTFLGNYKELFLTQ